MLLLRLIPLGAQFINYIRLLNRRHLCFLLMVIYLVSWVIVYCQLFSSLRVTKSIGKSLAVLIDQIFRERCNRTVLKLLKGQFRMTFYLRMLGL